MSFSLLHTDSKTKARAGVLQTAHGEIETPIFMPVGTAATVKGVHKDFLENPGDINPDIILGNTYHLYLRPGTNVLEQAGGLHKFSGWKKPILTDSGGYQVYSLSGTRKIKEEGVVFKSHIDGSRHEFTPENVMDIQRSIGADIIMAFDECTPYPCDKDYAARSMHMTHRWLDRCFYQFNSTKEKYGYSQILAPILQGSVYDDLRVQSAEYVCGHNSEVYAIGGLSVGEPHEDMYRITNLVTDILPTDKARYLMGVGTPENILECIERGIDMFDCVMPTRNGRNGYIFTTEGIINAKNKKWETCFEPIDPILTTEYHLAYTRHLFTSKEMLGPIIASIQNLRFYLWLVRHAREAILIGNFTEWKIETLAKVNRRL